MKTARPLRVRFGHAPSVKITLTVRRVAMRVATPVRILRIDHVPAREDHCVSAA